MYHSSKFIAMFVFNSTLNYSNSFIGYKMEYFRNIYAVDITKHDPSVNFSHVKATGTYNTIANNATVDSYCLFFMCDLTFRPLNCSILMIEMI